jgi:putative serine protease PepD
MTTTFDPFTPAGAGEQPGYGREQQGYGGEQPEYGGEQPGYGGRRRGGDGRRTAEAHWTEDQGWTGQQQGWVEAAEPVHPRSWTDDPRWAAERPREARVAEPWGDPAPETSRGATRTWQTGSMPAVGYGRPAAAPAPARGPGRTRLAVIGLVAVLVVVAAWQAYRIEGMTTDNHALASVLTTEKDRTDKLEKQLAGVFDPEAVSSKVLPSVFRVRAGDFTGTAFSVGTKATGGKSNLLTNYHVVDEVYSAGGRTVSLERGSTQIKATIVKVDKVKDLALLSANQKITGLATAGTQVKPGQQVVVVGAPLGLDDTVTSGVVSAYRPDDQDGPTIQFDAPINPGNSGGPVVNANDQVVGLATAKAKDAEGIGLAIPIKTACDTFAVC